MPDATIAADLNQALDVQGDVSSQVALNGIMLVDIFTEFGCVVLREVLHPDIRVNAGRRKDVLCGLLADSVNIGQTDLDSFFAGQVYTSDTSH